MRPTVLLALLALLPLVVGNDRGPGMTWEERWALDVNRRMLLQQVRASRCDELLTTLGERPRPRQIALHGEIARRNLTPLAEAQRTALHYFRREYGAFWVRGIARERERMVAWLNARREVDAPTCRANGAELARRLARGWPYLRRQALDALP